MKRNRITILSILIFIYSCSNNVEKAEKDTELLNLIGDVKSITSKTISDSIITEQTKVYFDKYGYVLSKEYYQEDTIVKIESNKRDKNHKIISKKTELANGTSQVQTYDYGNNGLKMIIQKLNGTQNTIWRYENDDNGRKVKETIIIDDKIVRVIKYQHINDSLSRTVIYNEDGKKENMIEYIVTEDKVETTFQTYFSKNITATSKIVMLLDSLSNPIKEVHYREDEKSDLLTYWYNFDEKMNWNKKFTYSNEELIQSIQREIEYYE
ncbi:MAG: hypothetical protein K0B10_00020 [Vicingaceae bacterium]|nr:hypothetical protein [Vicingaceae bacterium]